MDGARKQVVVEVGSEPGESLGEPIDESRLLDNMAGSREILVEAGQVFLEDVGRMLRSLRDHVDSEADAASIERAAHLLKGALLSMAATEAIRIAAAIEARARAGVRSLREDVDALSKELDRVRSALVRIMNAG